MALKTAVVFLVVMVGGIIADKHQHTTLNDNYDLKAVVKDPEALKAFTLCFIHEGPCTDLTRSFRSNMPEAMPEACARCTEGQKIMFGDYLDGLEKTAPKLYKRYSTYYDPKGIYMKRLRAKLSKSNL